MIRIDDERGEGGTSLSILSFWKIQYWKEMHGGRRGLPCISFHLNPARL